MTAVREIMELLFGSSRSALELLYTSGSVHYRLFSSVKRMGCARYLDLEQGVLFFVAPFSNRFRLDGRTYEKTLTACGVFKNYLSVVFGVYL
jgi:hypothetical protein